MSKLDWYNIPEVPKKLEGTLYITGWKSSETGYACRNHGDGHQPTLTGDLITDTESRMTGEPMKCRCCSQELTWAPVKK
jgi:hypothetical protein